MTIKLDPRNRAPAVLRLPDTRLRITREYDILPNNPSVVSAADLLASVWQPWGTQDTFYTQCRLTHQDIPKGQLGNPFDTPNNEPPRLIRVFEELNYPGETQVGNTDITIEQDNRVTAVNTSLQFSAGTSIFGRVGVDSIVAGTTTCILKSDERTDDGTLKTIKRTYISAGTIQTTNEIKNNGALLIQSVKSVYTEPPTPSGYTIIRRDVTYPSGLPVYDYTFAKGDGEISRNYQGIQAGTSSFDLTPPITPVQGAIIETVKYLTAGTTTVLPTTSNLSNGARFAVGIDQQDGYKVWTVSYGQGAGIVEFDNEYRNNGKLVIYHKTGFGAVPATPAATIGGSVILISQKQSNADGFISYDLQWAEGFGEIFREYEYRDSVDEGVTGLTLLTIKHLTAPSVAVNPISAGTTFILVQSGYEDSSGYRIWTSRFGKGVGTITSENILRNEGRLVIYNRVTLGSPPATPAATIGGTVTLIKSEIRLDRFHEGTTLYDYSWAEGLGTVENTQEARPDGSQEYRYVTLSAAAATPAAPAGLIAGTSVFLVHLTNDASDGHYVNRATYIQPPTNYTVPIQVAFRKPGLVTAANPPTITPPVSLDIMGTNTVTFSPTQTAATPYKISSYSTLTEYFTYDQDGATLTFSQVKELPGYLGSSTLTLTNATYRGYSNCTGVVTVSGSNPTTLPTGVKTLHVRCEKYLTDVNGVTIWRNEVVTADVT